SRLFSDFELNWRAGLALADHSARAHLIALHHVLDAQVHEVASTKLAVDRQIEERQIADPMRYLQSHADRPNFTRLQRRLLARHPPFIPRHKRCGVAL